MDNEPEVIRDQMQETRTALTEKLEALEQQVSNTVQTATSTVAETVQTVKEAVEDTVDTVKETVEQTVETVQDTFDITAQVERHPWMAMAGSVAVGYLAGRLLHAGQDRDTGVRSMAALTHSEPKATHNGANGAGKGEAKESKEDAEEGWMQGLLDGFSGELQALKDLGLAAMMAIVRDLTTRSIQGEVGTRVQTWMNEVTEKMGVSPIKEPILQEPQTEPSPSTEPETPQVSPEKGESGSRKQRPHQQSRSRR